MMGSGATTAALLWGGAGVAVGMTSPEEHRLAFDRPASRPIDGLPVGNGRQGAMVLGGPRDERIVLNDDCFWAGQPQDVTIADSPQLLAQIRAALFACEYDRADALCQKLQGPFTHSYAPLADLRLGMNFDGEALDYRRWLDLDLAETVVEFVAGDTRYRRTVIASHVDKLLFVRVERLAGSGKFGLEVDLQTQLRGSTRKVGNGLTLTVKAPTHADPNYYEALIGPTVDPVVYADETGKGMFGAVVARIVETDGRIDATSDALKVNGASEVLIALSTATGFRGFKHLPDVPADAVVATAEQPLRALAAKGWSAIHAAHVADHQALYRRVSLTLGSSLSSTETTDQRVERVANDPALAALLFNYGRYLLIASSRPGSQAANLQGIWSWDVRPPWSANYTTNINVQENYWPAEVCNLSELSDPYVDLVTEVAQNGAKTAKDIYGLQGWCCHHNTDLWRLTTPVGEHKGEPKWANFALAAPWLVRQLWERWLYGGDREFLRSRAYPLMRGCALFCSDWLIPSPDGKYLVTAPSVSTENSFLGPDGKRHDAAIACTMDIAMIREVLTTSAAAADLLRIDAALAKRWRDLAGQLPPYQIGNHGQLQEWLEDYGEAQPDQRHLSHLYPFYPSDELTPWSAPKLAAAAETSLDHRIAANGGPIGWSESWKVNLFARLRRPQKALAQLHRFLRVSANGNLLSIMDKGPGAIFQIDGNFAMTAGIAEMLLQSHGGRIQLLPALPREWSDGAVRGLRTRGGLVVEMRWAGGRLLQAWIQATRPGVFRLSAGTGQQVASLVGEGRHLLPRGKAADYREYAIDRAGVYTVQFT